VKRIALLIIIALMFSGPTWTYARDRYDRFSQSQHREQYSDRYFEQEWKNQELEQRLEQQRRELNKLHKQQEELQNQFKIK